MKQLLLVAVMVLVTLVGMVGFSHAGDAVSALQATAKATDGAVGTLQAAVNEGVPVRAKMYYLTATSFTGGDAIRACDPGFHMARISEIQDPSNLQYANGSTTVYDSLWFQPTTQVDNPVLGPPSNQMGWVRSGDNLQPKIGHEVDYGVYYEADYKIVPEVVDYGVYHEADYYYSVYQSLSDPQNVPELRCSAFWYDARSGQPASDPTVIAHVVRHLCSPPERVWCVEDPE